MPIFTPTSPARLVLEVTWLDHEEKPKLDVTSATVTVFHRDALGARVVDLAPTAMTVDASTSTWKFVWTSPGLTTPGFYVVEYAAVDTAGATGFTKEDLTVHGLQVMMDEVLDCLLGRQTLDVGTHRWTLFRRDGTVLKVFDVKDDTGAPSADDVFDRIPVP